MRLLIITQKIDISDDNLGFFHRWVEEFAKNTEEIFVIANFAGEYHLPAKVKIFSLGKEKGFGRIRRYFNFFRYLLKILPKSDAVFVHMIPAWVAMGWPFYKIFRKKVYLWYTHKSVTFSLRLAEKIVERIFTASEKSFRLPSQKVKILGHGIDLEKFKPSSEFETRSLRFRIITAGRISRSKNLRLLIEAAAVLKNKGFDFEVRIAGAPIFAVDNQYLQRLKDLVIKNNLENIVKFSGAIPYAEIEKFYQKGDLFVNLSATGSLDKSVLEAMACGVNILVSNEAFFGLLPEENFVQNLSGENIAARIKFFMDNKKTDNNLREIVVKNHNLKELIENILKYFQE